ncbi:hypothetical protein B0A50_03799 [Salinomyces thailandicus]|uniref:Uncharacterized protein n=1 Tax=Salinomyces thailandicus TaxID=706561 RepID=A0A4V5N4V3_9PEZI|nr:hypothetical protein B0A50_03799 [Salinomyces thailandica]
MVATQRYTIPSRVITPSQCIITQPSTLPPLIESVMDNSPLNKLPQELRDDIYERVLTQAGPVAAHLRMSGTLRMHRTGLYGRNDSNAETERLPAAVALTGLPLTCKQMRREIGPMFFDVNSFHITCIGLLEDDTEADDDDTSPEMAAPTMPFDDLDTQLLPRYLSHIQDLTISLVDKVYLETIDLATLRQVGHSLRGLKARLHEQAKLAAEVSFDRLDADLPAGMEDEPLTVTVRTPVGDVYRAQGVLGAAIKERYDIVVAAKPEVDPELAWVAFWDFGEEVWGLVVAIAG